jgi:hypothetical protein
MKSMMLWWLSALAEDSTILLARQQLVCKVSVQFAITPQAVHIVPLRRAVEHRAQAVV